MNRPHIKTVNTPSAKPFNPPNLEQIRSADSMMEDCYSIPRPPKAKHIPAQNQIENNDLEMKGHVPVPLDLIWTEIIDFKMKDHTLFSGSHEPSNPLTGLGDRLELIG